MVSQPRDKVKDGESYKRYIGGRVYTKGGYWRGDKFIKITWGDKISKTQSSREYIEKRSKLRKCNYCGKEYLSYISSKIFCNRKCAWQDKKKNHPIEYKAYVWGANLVMGKGKTAFLIKFIEKQLNQKCVYCKEVLTLINISLDHKEPFGEGRRWRGKRRRLKHLRKDKPENLQIICRKCNGLKGNFPHDKYMKLLKFLDSDKELKNLLLKRLRVGIMGFKKIEARQF